MIYTQKEIKDLIAESGRSKKWYADKLGVRYQTLLRSLKSKYPNIKILTEISEYFVRNLTKGKAL